MFLCYIWKAVGMSIVSYLSVYLLVNPLQIYINELYIIERCSKLPDIFY